MKITPHVGCTRFALTATLSAVLAACGGGGGSSAPETGSPPPTATTQLTGKAIDGYLSGATVCFDNGQGACDTSQPSTTTDASGNYTLKVSGTATGKQLDVIVSPATTDGGKAFTSTFTLSAIVSGSAQNVTPLTTMVVSQMKTGQSLQQATQAVQSLVGSNVDPNSDYVGNGDTGTATIAADMVSHMTVLAGQGPISWTQVQATMNAYAARGSVDAVRQADVAAQLANPAFSTAVAATTALSTPLYTVDGDLQQPFSATSTGGLSPIRENYTLNGSMLSITQEVQSNGSWSALSPVGSFDNNFFGSWAMLDNGVGAYEMKTDGSWTSWLTAAQLHPSYSLSTVGSSLVGTDPNTNDQVTLTYRTTDVSGWPLTSALQIAFLDDDVHKAMTGTFPSGTTAYLATTAHANDQLILVDMSYEAWNWVNGTESWATSTVNGSPFYTFGVPGTTYTSVQQIVGMQIDISGGCQLLTLQANGVATVDKSGMSTCTYTNDPNTYPVAASWSVYPRNPNVITVSLPKSLAGTTTQISSNIKNVINMGGSLVFALNNGMLMGGYMLPASQPQTVPQFPAAITDTIAASMRAAAATLNLQQNP